MKIDKKMMLNILSRARAYGFFLFIFYPLAGVCLAKNAMQATRSDLFIEQSQPFLDGHPDIKYRNLGFQNYKKSEYAEAIKYFKRAAYYADKPSQAMIGEMYWKGEGISVDKSQAYAWLDLASERQYPNLLSIRERYWNGLDLSQQQNALVIGKALYDKYGDEAAKKRLEAKLRAMRAKTTGSRTGATGFLTVYLAGPDGEGIAVDGSQFYQEQYWNPEMYWQWQDKTWKTLSGGTVTASELMPVTPPAAPKKDDE